MLTKEEIKRLAKLNKIKPYQQEKHYIQTLILRSIYSDYDLVFKGGTALMFTSNLPRFSEDLDFSNQKNNELAKLPPRIKKDLELYGIPSSIKIISHHSDSYSFRLTAQGPLFTQELDQCFVRVEISSRETLVLKPNSFFIKPDYPNQLPFSIIVMDVSEILAEKFRALLTRNKARDIYDIWFLLEHNIEISTNLINKKLKYYKMKFNKLQIHDAIKAKKILWERELRPIIIGELPKFKKVETKILEALARF